MRTTRGFLGALGAGGALIAAAACGLLIVGAMVAEKGWPGVASPLDPAKLVANSAPAGAVGTPVVPTVRVAAAPVSHVSAPRHRGAHARPGSRHAHGGSPALRPVGAATPIVAGGLGTPAGSPGSASAATGSGGQGSGTQGSGSGGHGSAGTLGSTVQGAAQNVANAVGPTSPGAANAVNQAGSSAGGVVDKTTTAVANTLSHLPGR